MLGLGPTKLAKELQALFHDVDVAVEKLALVDQIHFAGPRFWRSCQRSPRL